MLELYARALVGSLPIVGGGGNGTLPQLAPSAEGVEADRDQLAAYDRVCGFRLRDALPSTYIHVLAFPLALRLLVDRAFPFPALGLVHVRNRIVQHRPVRLGEALDLDVRAERLAEHPRGQTVDVVGRAHVDGELVWEDVSSYLAKGRGNPAAAADDDGPEVPGDLPQRSRWDVPGDIGRRYAAVSGDRNPIHLHPLSAKAFGLKAPIAHGMWVKARCLAALEDVLPEAYTVDVRFKAPLFVPGKVVFAGGEDGFAVRSRSGKPHLEGQIS
jgi:acyl dehydratase